MNTTDIVNCMTILTNHGLKDLSKTVFVMEMEGNVIALGILFFRASMTMD